MNPLCRRALLAVWTLTSIYPYLAHCLTLTVTTKQPYPGGAISIDSTTTSTDPSQANLYIYDTTKQQQTELWTAWPAPESPHSIFTVPSTVTPGTTYVIRATSVDGNTVLANSATFQIFAAFAVTSASGSSSSQTSMSSFTSSVPSTTSTTPSTSAPASTSSSSSSASTTPEPSHNSVPIGPIIGGVLGGLALIAVILALLLLFRRRKPAKPTAFLLDKAPPPETFPSQANIAKRDPTVSPFTLTTPPMHDRPPPVMDAKHPAPPGPPSGTFPSGKKGLFGPTPASATSSSGFSSSEKSRLMASASPSTSCPDVRIELEELKAQVKTLELQNQAAGLHPLAPPTYQ